MSWSDNNVIPIDNPDYSWLEILWNNGKHEDKIGNQYKLSEMTISHLVNTINLFYYVADTYKLIEELKTRY